MDIILRQKVCEDGSNNMVRTCNSTIDSACIRTYPLNLMQPYDIKGCR